MRCALPGGAHSGVVGVKTLLAHNQSVEVGYNFSRSDQSVVGFASVSASLSPLGARTDIAPVPQAAANRSGVIELRVFVDGHEHSDDRRWCACQWPPAGGGGGGMASLHQPRWRQVPILR